jgi:hypothetical protein
MFPKQSQGSYELVAPVGGLNARDNLRTMPENDAETLINFFPRTSDIITRRGSLEHCDSTTATMVKSLARLIEADGAQTLIAGSGNKLYDVTTATPSLEYTATTDIFQFVEFGNELFFVNGVDSCQKWDGSSMATVTWTGSGLTATDLIDVTAFKSRLWFIEKNTGSAWYGGLRAKTGALTEFDLSGLVDGALYTAASISRQTSAGDTSQIAFFSSAGDVLIYDGDPASSLVLVGRATMPKLLSRKSIASYGQDLLLLTEAGVIPLSSLFSAPTPYVVTDKINRRLIEEVELYSGLYGWQVFFYAAGRQILINVPTSTITAKQYVINLDSGAFSEYQGMNAFSWSMFGNKPHFGKYDGTVHTADTGYADDGTPISYKYRSAPTFLGSRTNVKKVSRVKPYITVTRTHNPTYSLQDLYSDSKSSVETEVVKDVTLWGSPWGSSWATDMLATDVWEVLPGHGKAFILEIEGSNSLGSLTLQGIEILFERGNGL